MSLPTKNSSQRKNIGLYKDPVNGRRCLRMNLHEDSHLSFRAGGLRREVDRFVRET